MHCSLLIFMATMTLWTETKAFRDMLDRTRYLDKVLDSSKQGILSSLRNTEWQLVRKKYLDLQQLANLINQTIGPNVTFCILETILYYAISLDEVVKHGDYNKVAEALYFIFELVYICLIILIAADIPQKVGLYKYNRFVIHHKYNFY